MRFECVCVSMVIISMYKRNKYVYVLHMCVVSNCGFTFMYVWVHSLFSRVSVLFRPIAFFIEYFISQGLYGYCCFCCCHSYCYCCYCTQCTFHNTQQVCRLLEIYASTNPSLSFSKIIVFVGEQIRKVFKHYSFKLKHNNSKSNVLCTCSIVSYTHIDIEKGFHI